MSQVVLFDRLSSLNLSNQEEGQDIETLVRLEIGLSKSPEFVETS